MRGHEPLAPLPAKACECERPLLDDDTCTHCGRTVPGATPTKRNPASVAHLERMMTTHGIAA